MKPMSINVPQNKLRIAAQSLSEFTVPAEKHGATAAAALIDTVATEMRLLADTQAVNGLHANAINICRVETCLENLRAAAVVIAEHPSDNQDEDVMDEARRLLAGLHAELLNYDDELKAA